MKKSVTILLNLLWLPCFYGCTQNENIDNDTACIIVPESSPEERAKILAESGLQIVNGATPEEAAALGKPTFNNNVVEGIAFYNYPTSDLLAKKNLSPERRAALEAQVKLEENTTLTGSQYIVNISKERAKEIGIPDSDYDKYVNKMESFNKAIKVKVDNGETFYISSAKGDETFRISPDGITKAITYTLEELNENFQTRKSLFAMGEINIQMGGVFTPSREFFEVSNEATMFFFNFTTKSHGQNSDDTSESVVFYTGAFMFKGDSSWTKVTNGSTTGRCGILIPVRHKTSKYAIVGAECDEAALCRWRLE